MQELYVYADFDWLPQPEFVGMLVYQAGRGDGTYSFTFDNQWLARHGGVVLSDDLRNFSGPQYAKDRIFACFSDVQPDRWGRTLAERREQLEARRQGRIPRHLSSFDYLLAIDDFSRMGAFRFKSAPDGEFINIFSPLQIPPLASLRELIDAAHKVEMSESKDVLPEEKWIRQLLHPGTSLGGARPKASVMDDDENLLIAKFPSRSDRYDVSLWEHFCHLLARRAGITVAETQVLPTDGRYHALLSRRFDRTSEGRRVHFASSMALLGLRDGAGEKTGNGYLDIVDFILQSGGAPQHDLAELYRRVAFNMCVGNCDDHFRNHGFLLTSRGWVLSPAYDMNPSLGLEHSLLVTEYSNHSDLHQLLLASESYMLPHSEAQAIIAEVRTAVSTWRTLAQQLRMSKVETQLFAPRLDWSLN